MIPEKTSRKPLCTIANQHLDLSAKQRRTKKHHDAYYVAAAVGKKG